MAFKPPRGNIYCEALLLYHPIASPTAAQDWRGSPPLWFASGQEQIVDGVKVIAQAATKQGVTVSLQEFEAMPHTFMWSLPDPPQSQKCWQDWANTCKVLSEGNSFTSNSAFVQAKGLQSLSLDMERLTPVTVDIARNLMREGSKRFETYTGQEGNNSKL